MFKAPLKLSVIKRVVNASVEKVSAAHAAMNVCPASMIIRTVNHAIVQKPEAPRSLATIVENVIVYRISLASNVLNVVQATTVIQIVYVSVFAFLIN